MLNILYIGDISGKPGRKTLAALLPDLRKKHKLDLVIANVDNLAHGNGVTPATIEEILGYGVDICVGGDHIWDNLEGLKALKSKLPLIRALNHPPRTPGHGTYILAIGKVKLAVIALQGNTFMRMDLPDPFSTVMKEVKRLRKAKIKNIIVDFHAEATSEKQAMKYYLDGQVSAVFGTHTHVPTADVQVSEEGTAYITDVGMCGSDAGVLGVKKEIIIQKFLTQTPARHELEEHGLHTLDSVLLELDEKSGKAQSLEQIIQKINF